MNTLNTNIANVYADALVIVEYSTVSFTVTVQLEEALASFGLYSCKLA